jgi:hypothetical protein
MQPQRGQYNIVLANDTYLVAFVKKTILYDIWLGGSQRLICIKPILSYKLLQKSFYQNFIYEGQK